MKKIRRLLSIVLVCALVLPCISSGWVAKAETDDTIPTIQKLDFEDGIPAGDSYNKNTVFSIYNSEIAGDTYNEDNVRGTASLMAVCASTQTQSYRTAESITLSAGKSYRVTFWYKIVTEVPDNTYCMTFKPSQSGYDTTYITTKSTTNNQWQSKTLEYTIGETDTDLTFMIYEINAEKNRTEGSFVIYIDDVVAAEQVTVSAASDGNGSAVVDEGNSSTVYAGDTATFVATPNEGYHFAGWKDETGEIVSTKATYSHTVTEGITLTACFEKTIQQVLDFENGIPTGETVGNSFSLYNQENAGQEYTTDNVYEGNASLKTVCTGAMTNYVTRGSIKLSANKTYRVTFWYKATSSLADNAALIYYRPNGSDYGSVQDYIRSNSTTNGQWRQVEKVYTIGSTDTYLQFTTYGDTSSKPAGSFTVYIDDIVVSEAFSVSATVESGGTATVNGVASTTAYAGDTVTYVATPAEGYHFVAWKDETGKVVSEELKYSYTVTEGITLTAYFEKTIQQVLDFESGIPTGETVGNSFSLYNPENVGQEYTTDNVYEGNASLKVVCTGAMTNYVTRGSIKLSANKTYKVTFWYKATSSLADNAALIYYRPNGSDYGSVQDYIRSNSTTNGQWRPVEKVYTIGSSDTYLQFTTYGDATSKPAGSFTVYIDDIVVSEAFTVSATAESGGTATVNGATSTTAYAYDEISYQATPADGYEFTGWENAEGQIISTDAIYKVIVKEDIELKACFEERESYTATASKEGSGTATVNGATSAKVYVNETATFVATPGVGYHFVGWKNPAGEIVSEETTYSCTITENITLIACFEKPIRQIQDFENGIGANDMQQNAYSLYDSSTVEYSADNVHGGENSLKMSAGATSDLSKYRPQTNIQLEKGKTYKVSFWYKATATTVGETDYTTKSLFIFEINGNDTSERTWIKHTNGEWTKFEKVYTVTNTSNVAEDTVSPQFLSYKHVADAYEVYIDDIVVSEAFSVSSSVEGGGTVSTTVNGKAVTTAYAYDEVIYQAVPNARYVFTGWKNADGEIISTDATYTIEVTEDIALTACFTRVYSNIENLEEGFGADDVHQGAYSIYDVTTEGNSADNVYEGTKSLKMVAGYNLSKYRPHTNIKVENGKTYTVSFWYKATATDDYQSNSLFIFGINGNATSEREYLKHTDGEWKKFERTYTVNWTDTASAPTEDKVGLQFMSYQLVEGAYEVYIDDIRVGEPVTVSAINDGNGVATVDGEWNAVSFVNDVVTYEAVANNGYKFINWTDAEGNEVSTSQTYICTVSEAIELKANFEKILYGDVNIDDAIDILDLVYLDNCLDNSTNIENELADCYKDNVIDETDWITLRKALLSLVELPVSKAEATSQNSLFAANAVTETTYFTRNTTAKYTGFDASLLCDGTSLESGASHQIYYFKVPAKKYTDYEVSAYCCNLAISTSNIQMYSAVGSAYIDASEKLGIIDSVLQRYEWDEIKMVVNTGDSDTLTVGIIVYPGQKFYFSGLTTTELVYSGSYCEDFYNLLADKKEFEVNGADVKEITVKADKAGRYKLGYTANVPEGTQAKVTVLANGTEVYRASIATEGAWERFQTEMMLEADTEVVIRIETPDGITMFDDMYFFQSKYAYVYNPNDYTDYTYKATPSRNATYAATSAVKLSVANSAITEDFAGFGGMYYAYNYIPDGKDRTYTDEMQTLELKRLAASGTTVVRTQFSPAWAWDEETDTWNWESEEMQGFYQYMADMKELGMDVAINTDWSLTSVRAKTTTGNYENPFYVLGNGVAASCDTAFVEWVVDAVTTIRDEKGYDNLKYLFMFTEPVHTTNKATYDTQFALWKEYVVAVDSALEAAGVRNDIQMVGFNNGVYSSTAANKNGITDWYPLEKMAADQAILDAIDIFTHHTYISTAKDEDNYATWYEFMSKCVEIANSVNKPFWFDEGEWSEANPDSWTEGLSTGYHGLQLGVKMLAAMNSGLQGVMRWTLVDQYWMNDGTTKEDYKWTNGCHIWGLLPNMYSSTIPRNSYYAYSLLAKYTNGENVQVYKGTEADGVYIASVKNGNDTTVFVINMNDSAKEIEVTLGNGLASQNLNRHTYSATDNKPTTAAHIADSDLTLKSVTNKFNDKIGAHSIYVYTTAE